MRRARAGERIIITVDGVPAAQIGPVTEGQAERTIEELIAAGLVIPPRTKTRPPPPKPLPWHAGRTTTEIILEDRERG